MSFWEDEIFFCVGGGGREWGGRLTLWVQRCSCFPGQRYRPTLLHHHLHLRRRCRMHRRRRRTRPPRRGLPCPGTRRIPHLLPSSCQRMGRQPRHPLLRGSFTRVAHPHTRRMRCCVQKRRDTVGEDAVRFDEGKGKDDHLVAELHPLTGQRDDRESHTDNTPTEATAPPLLRRVVVQPFFFNQKSRE